jgi:hypothetical protein
MEGKGRKGREVRKGKDRRGVEMRGEERGGFGSIKSFLH